MTVAEFFGCAFLAFGAPLAMFVFTIADSPIKIILLIFSSFLWLLALLCSSFVWFIIVPLRDYLFFGVIVSVFIQVSTRKPKNLSTWISLSTSLAGRIQVCSLQASGQDQRWAGRTCRRLSRHSQQAGAGLCLRPRIWPHFWGA